MINIKLVVQSMRDDDHILLPKTQWVLELTVQAPNFLKTGVETRSINCNVANVNAVLVDVIGGESAMINNVFVEPVFDYCAVLGITMPDAVHDVQMYSLSVEHTGDMFMGTEQQLMDVYGIPPYGGDELAHSFGAQFIAHSL